MNKNVLYRSIPKVDILLGEKQIQDMIERYSRETVMEAIHGEMEKLRAYIGRCEEEEKAKNSPFFSYHQYTITRLNFSEK